ncbi:MAG: arsenic resistance protein [Nitrospinota bacterium]|nr:MAG: arsenic resistance protein [Nitrospinota bacterium]
MNPPTQPHLSIRDESKPLLLIAAILIGILLNRLAGGVMRELYGLVNIGLFLVIFAIMAFVEIKEVGQALAKVKPTALALLTNFLFTPLFAWFLGWLFLRHYPDFWAGVILYKLTPCIGWYLIFIDLAEGDVPWGVALLPWNLVLQILLLPVYMWLLVGKVVPIEPLTLIRSVGLFLFLPFVTGYLTRLLLLRWRGREWTYGPFKQVMGEVKLWALVLVVIGIFASQEVLEVSDLGRIGLIILVIALFFISLFLIGLAVGRIFLLDYAETTTLVFTTTARNSEAVVGVAATAFPGHPLVLFAILIGPIVELPVLILLSRIMLALRTRWQWKVV